MFILGRAPIVSLGNKRFLAISFPISLPTTSEIVSPPGSDWSSWDVDGMIGIVVGVKVAALTANPAS